MMIITIIRRALQKVRNKIHHISTNLYRAAINHKEIKQKLYSIVVIITRKLYS